MRNTALNQQESRHMYYQEGTEMIKNIKYRMKRNQNGKKSTNPKTKQHLISTNTTIIVIIINTKSE